MSEETLWENRIRNLIWLVMVPPITPRGPLVRLRQRREIARLEVIRICAAQTNNRVQRTENDDGVHRGRGARLGSLTSLLLSGDIDVPKSLPIRAVGIPWYARENYRRVLEVMEDAEKLPATFEKWLYAAQRGERELTSKGHTIVRDIIDADEFVLWCRGRGLNVDAKARMEFANEAAYRAIKDTH